MKTLISFVLGLLIGAGGMFYMLQNSLQNNVGGLIDSVINTVQNSEIESNDVPTPNSDGTGDNGFDIEGLKNNLIKSQKEKMIKVLNEQKEKLKSELQGSINGFINEKINNIFGGSGKTKDNTAKETE